MSRLFKVALYGVGVIVLLAILAIAAVYFLVDPEDYRGLIIETVEEQTGRTLKIDGDLGLDLLPCCGIAVGGAELGNARGFKSPYFARIEEASIGLRVLPLLLQRNVVMGELRLVGLDLALEENASGATNWTFETDAAAEAPAEADTGDVPRLDSLSVAGIVIRDAVIRYSSASGTDIRLEDVALQTGRIAPGEPFDMDGGLTFVDNSSGQSAELRIAARATAEEEPLRIVFDEIKADVDVVGVKLSLTGGGELSAETVALAGRLEVPTVSPQKILADLGEEPIETADSSVLKKFSVRGEWALDDERFAVENLDARLDDSVITGRAQNNYAGRGDTQFTVTIDDIDLDRYLAPESDEAAGGESAAADDEELPLDTLRELDLGGKLTAKQLRVGGVRMSDLTTTVAARNGRIVLDPLAAKLYDGQYSGKLTLDVSGRTAKASVEQNVSGVQASGLLRDFAETENIEGLLNVRITGTGSGNSITTLIENLVGDVSFDLQDGVYKDMDVWHEIRRARALLRRKAPPPAPSPAQTEIKTLTLRGRIADSVFSSNQIVGEIPFLQLTGSGTVGLIEQNLNFRFRAKVVETPVFEDGSNLDDLTGLTIPVSITGSVEDPDIGVDLENLAKDVAVEKAKEKLLDKLFKDEPQQPADPNAPEAAPQEESAGDALKRGLRDLLGN